MQRKLEGKIALVSGAGRGIGRAIALKLAGEGARIVVNDLDEGPALEVVESIRSAGGEAINCNGSVTVADFGERFVGAAMSAFHGLDIIVNNAGYAWPGPIQRMTDEQWCAMIDCHMTAPFRILRAAQAVVHELHRAEAAVGKRVVRKVVNISSMAGVFGGAGMANYSAAKAGVIGLTKTLAKEWGRYAVTVNCVAFGLINTRMTDRVAGQVTTHIDGREIELDAGKLTSLDEMERNVPLGRAGTPEEAAGAVYLFCIPESDYVSGETLICSGGLTGI
jgi:3-oxoacyl-[acyl-carrier protein] reductase